MSAQYPDILGDFFDASQRLEADGIQYIAYFEPNAVPVGQCATLVLAVQNTFDDAAEFSIFVNLPKVSNRLEGFKVAEARGMLTLSPAAVSELRIPVLPIDVPPGTYPIRLQLQGQTPRGAQRVRAPKSKGRLPDTPIRDVVGLQLASTIGVAYTSRTDKRPMLKLTVQEGSGPTEVSLSPTLESLWKHEDLDIQVRAAQEFNDRRLHIVPPLTRPVLFAALLNESRQRFASAGIDLTLGEGIFLGKILTRTVELFFSNEALQDALFIPIFQRLLLADVPFDNAVWLLMKFGYEHVLKLSVALSFGLLETYRKERAWSLEEQRGVRHFVVSQLSKHAALPVDFLYVPLILGGILVGRQMVLPGEEYQKSLAAIRKVARCAPG